MVRKEWIIRPNYKKDNKTDHSNYRGMSRLSTRYKILFDSAVKFIFMFRGSCLG